MVLMTPMRDLWRTGTEMFWVVPVVKEAVWLEKDTPCIWTPPTALSMASNWALNSPEKLMTCAQ